MSSILKKIIFFSLGDGAAWKSGAFGSPTQPEISADEMEFVWKIFSHRKLAGLQHFSVLRYNVFNLLDAKWI